MTWTLRMCIQDATVLVLEDMNISQHAVHGRTLFLYNHVTVNAVFNMPRAPNVSAALLPSPCPGITCRLLILRHRSLRQRCLALANIHA